MNEVFNYAKCPICGNVVEDIHGNTTPLRCCGKPMEILKPNTTEAATEKHLPVGEVCDDEIVVKVGSVAHPMTKEHCSSLWSPTRKRPPAPCNGP